MAEATCPHCGAGGTPRDQRRTPDGTSIVGADVFGYSSVFSSDDAHGQEHQHSFGFMMLPYRCAAGHEWGQYSEVSCGCGWPETSARDEAQTLGVRVLWRPDCPDRHVRAFVGRKLCSESEEFSDASIFTASFLPYILADSYKECHYSRGWVSSAAQSYIVAYMKQQNDVAIFGSGFAVGALGGLIGLGGAEFRLPLLIGMFGFEALPAVIVNKATIASAIRVWYHAQYTRPPAPIPLKEERVLGSD